MTEYVVAISFPENSTTYEVYNTITNSGSSVGLVSAAIVQRDDAGHLTITEGGDVKSGDATVGGSLIGMLIGVLGGPLVFCSDLASVPQAARWSTPAVLTTSTTRSRSSARPFAPAVMPSSRRPTRPTPQRSTLW
ncbi:MULTISPECIES: hypothetical protein [Gordonia]|uniref:hypothetical protein n=1 Tax=Gordonia TaxID=2053 RepID=UPI000ABA4C50